MTQRKDERPISHPENNDEPPDDLRIRCKWLVPGAVLLPGAAQPKPVVKPGTDDVPENFERRQIH